MEKLEKLNEMNTRSTRKKDLYSQSNSIQLEQVQSKARNTTSSDAEDERDIDGPQFERFPSPTFNIHIHVPCYDSKNSKLFLPRIQPIINLHFDELARKLESNRNVQNEKSLYKTFQSLLAKISPKFGGVKFHFKKNSEEKDIQESNINLTPNSSQRHSNDKILKENMDSKKSQSVATETSERILMSDSVKITSKSNSHNFNSHTLASYELDKDIKLKKAVVVLTDICKTKDYKHLFISNDSVENQNNKNESSNNFADKVENNCSNVQKYEAGINSIKAEDESCTPGSFSPEDNINSTHISENCCRHSDIDPHTEKDINTKSHVEKIFNEKDQNFTALVEGWSFSDILNRFQLKHSEKLDKFAASSNSIIENRSNSGETHDNDKLSLELNKKIEETEYTEEEDLVEEFDDDNKLHLEINKDDININGKNCFDENLSDPEKSFSFLQYQNETVNDFFSEDSIHEFKNFKNEDFENEFASDSNESVSDECVSISGKKVSSKGIEDVEVIEHDLSSIKSSDIQENKFEVPETNKSSLSNVADPCFHLELIKKEMQRRVLSSTPIKKAQQNLKSKRSDIKSPPSGNTSSPKKMKLSDKSPEISEEKTRNSSQAENFISLKSSGSTEFSVASLDEIKPSTSDAKCFKRNMLFGNRVNRFSSPDQLRIYQLKKEAALKSTNH